MQSSPPARRYETVEQCIKRIETGFHERYARDEKLRKSLAGKNRRILMDITDGTSYNFNLVDGKLQDVGEGTIEKPDVRVKTSGADLIALFNKELNPVQAYMTRRVQIQAPFGDILFVKSLLG